MRLHSTMMALLGTLTLTAAAPIDADTSAEQLKELSMATLANTAAETSRDEPKSISVQKFEQILENIGIDPADFPAPDKGRSGAINATEEGMTEEELRPQTYSEERFQELLEKLQRKRQFRVGHNGSGKTFLCLMQWKPKWMHWLRIGLVNNYCEGY